MILIILMMISWLCLRRRLKPGNDFNYINDDQLAVSEKEIEAR